MSVVPSDNTHLEDPITPIMLNQNSFAPSRTGLSMSIKDKVLN
jgi:hypothetical protein